MHVGIVGCGYLGLELCRQLVDGGHTVTGIRRSDDGLAAIREAGGRATRADVTDPPSLAALPSVDAAVFAASSGGRGAGQARDVYVDGLEAVLDAVADRSAPPDRVVYASSTGVYGDHDGGWVDETTPVDTGTDRRRVLVDAERVALEGARDRGLSGTVARLAGIYGPGRYGIDRYLSGTVPPGYRNFIHRVDAAGAVRYLLETGEARDEVVIVADDEPTERSAVARWIAREVGVEPPDLTVDGASDGSRRSPGLGKRCSNAKLRSLGYELVHPTFRSGYADAVAERR